MATIDFFSLAMLLDLLGNTCVVAVFAYLLVHSRYFEDVVERRYKITSVAMLIFAFGLISIYGTVDGVSIYNMVDGVPVFSGAIANIRDVGPTIAGLVGGPVVGFGAGLIGGLHRYSSGGITGLSSGLATVIAGTLGGVVYYLNRKRFVGIPGTVLIVVAAVGINLGLALVIAKPFDQALGIVEQVALPMVIANGIGALVFAYIIDHMFWEKRVSRERDDFHSELERKNAELSIARDIQTSFLPESVPSLNGFDIAAMCIPANEVGGDFYDFIPIDPDHTAIAIADVSGKSISGALFMALSRADLRANAFWSASAASTVGKANSLIAQDSKSGMFVTLFYGVLDPKGRTMTYVNAGHNPPIVLDEKNVVSHTLDGNGIALGAIEDASYEERTIRLKSGTSIVLYTDGITEANNMKGELFGEERLAKTIRACAGLKAAEMLDRIKAETLAFCDGAPQADDMTLVVVKVL